MSEIKASGNLHGHDLTDLPVLNPGDWFGKSFLIEIGGSYSSLFLVVEASSMSDAIDELADSEKYGHLIIVEDEYLGDYPEDDRHYGRSGQVLDIDHLLLYGDERSRTPFPCRYHGEGLPDEGVLPAEFEHVDADLRVGH